MMADLFIGPREIANLCAILQREFQALGFSVHSHVIRKNPYFQHENYDFVGIETFLGRFGLAGAGVRSMLELPFNLNHRVYVFIFGSTMTFVLRRAELALLKRLGKTIVAIFCGCDIRHWSSHEPIVTKLGYTPICQECDVRARCHLRDKLGTVRILEKYAHHIYTRPAAADLLSRDYHLYWIPVELYQYECHIPGNPIPRIVHAPSDSSIKGTPVIEGAIARLQSEGYRLEYLRLENVSNREVRAHLASADMVIDQLKSYGPATLALEGMASGCAVLSGCKPEYNGFPSDVPVVDTGPETVYKDLKHLLENSHLIPELAHRGREYVEKYHDSRKVVRDMAKTIGIL